MPQAQLWLLPAQKSKKGELWAVIFERPTWGKTPFHILTCTNKLLRVILSSDDDDEAAIRAEVETLTKELNTPRNADELLAAYAGKEEVLVSHLRKMKEGQAVEELEPEKADEPPPAPACSEEALAQSKVASELADVESLLSSDIQEETKRQSGTAVKDEIESLVKDTNPGRSSDEMLKAYEGREEDLLKNLQKLKASQQDN